jgi:hypothetical protein
LLTCGQCGSEYLSKLNEWREAKDACEACRGELIEGEILSLEELTLKLLKQGGIMDDVSKVLGKGLDIS